MNEIIIKGGTGNHYHPPRGEAVSRRDRGNACKGGERKIDMGEVPNLDMNMLRKGRLSQKKYAPRTNQHSFGNGSESARKKSESLITDMKKISAQTEQRVEEAVGGSHQHELYFKRSYTNIKNRRLFLNQKHKPKQPSLQNIGNISHTTHICLSNPRKPSQKQSKLSNPAQQKSMANLSKSESCKARPVSYPLNPQQLFQAHKANQIQEISKRVVFRMNREKDKQLYDQAMNHIYQMARRNFFHERARSEMPCELDVNRITIPRRNYKEEWTEKLKKYQENAVKYRQEQEQTRPTEEKAIKSRKKDMRTKTDAKLVQQTTRNDTEYERTDFWLQVMDKPFSPWEYWP